MKLRSSRMEKGGERTAIACLALGITLALAGCQKAEEGHSESAGESGAGSETAGGRSVVSGEGGSKHFDAVAAHLELGGPVFGYMDIDGDVEKIAGLVQGILDTAKEQAGDELPPQLRTLQVREVLGELGLDGIEAVGMSSVKKGELYHNRAYAHIPEGRKGLLTIFGDEAQPFFGPTLAPEDADLMLEYRLNVKAGYELVSDMVTRFGGPEAAGELASAVSEPMPGVGITMAEVLGKLDTRLTVFGRIHPDKPLDIPDAPVQVPAFDLLIALDDVGWLYERMTGAMKQDMPPEEAEKMFVAGDGFERINLPPVPSPDMPIAEPVIYHDIPNKRVLAASSAAFLEECLAGESSIADSAEFKAAMNGLPEEGNMMSFVTARFMTEYRKLIESAIQSGPAGGPETAIVSKILEAVIPDPESAQASVFANVPEGILLASNAATSWKEAVAMSGLGVLGAGAGVFMPLTRSAQFEAEAVGEEAIRSRDEAVREQEALERATPDDEEVAPPETEPETETDPEPDDQ